MEAGIGFKITSSASAAQETEDCDAVLLLEGQLTWPHVRQFQTEMERCLAAGRRRVVVDLADLTYLDSSGLASFLPVHSKFQEAGGSIRLRNPRKLIYHVFASAHLDTVLTIERSTGDAGAPKAN